MHVVKKGLAGAVKRLAARGQHLDDVRVLRQRAVRAALHVSVNLRLLRRRQAQVRVHGVREQARPAARVGVGRRVQAVGLQLLLENSAKGELQPRGAAGARAEVGSEQARHERFVEQTRGGRRRQRRRRRRRRRRGSQGGVGGGGWGEGGLEGGEGGGLVRSRPLLLLLLGVGGGGGGEAEVARAELGSEPDKGGVVERSPAAAVEGAKQ
mmetsp:Transcript_32960/g.105722  ORF Transcript_32960/g.105722 Transcript_32960/m.105722 type:complete len:210 (-) Transcript_32960:132-761(-)